MDWTDARRHRIRAILQTPGPRQHADAYPHGGAGAALAAGLLLAFYNPASGGSGISLPGSGAVPAPAPAAPLTGGEQAIVTKVKPAW